jgi:hypothetical protein
VRLAAVAAAVAVVVLVAPAAGATRPPVALIASPAHVDLVGSGRSVVTVTNSGTETAVVDVLRAGYALDVRGRPRVAARRASWLAVVPARLTLAPGASGTITVTSKLPRRARPGDHPELVLFTTHARPGRGLPVRVRLGVVVVVRAPGKVVHRLDLAGVNIRRAGRQPVLRLRIDNRGNVIEALNPACSRVVVRHGRVVLAMLRPPGRRLLPRTFALVDVVYRGRFRGPARVRLSPAVAGRCPIVARGRWFPVRL